MNHNHSCTNRRTMAIGTKMRAAIIVSALILTVVSGCAHQAGGLKKPCSVNVPESPMPKWVHVPPVSTTDFVGVSSAVCATDQRQCQAAADLNARTELAKTIKVEVESFLEDRMQYISEGERDEFHQKIESISKEHVDMVLKGVKPVARWFDQENCTMWSQVRLSKAQYQRDKEELERKLAQTVKRKRFMVVYCAKDAGDLEGGAPSVEKAAAIIKDALAEKGIDVQSAPAGSHCSAAQVPDDMDVDVLVTFRIWYVKVTPSSDDGFVKVTLKLNATAANVATRRDYIAADQRGEAMTRADRPNLDNARYKAAISAANRYAKLLVQRIEELSRVE